MSEVIIIPVYEPETCLEGLVDKLWKEGNYILLVDDGSSGESKELFYRLSEEAIVLHHEKNRGKGAAIKTALNYIKENIWDCDVIGIMDGDGQHLPEDMERLIFRSRDEKDSLMLGVRNVDGKMPLRSRLGNLVTRKIFRLLSGVWVSWQQI